MYDVSDRFLDAIAGTHRAVVKARLVDGTQFGTSPSGTELPILSGDVKFSATADVKATLDIVVPGDFWASVQPYGAEIWVARGVAFGDGTEELVPLGYYRINDVQQDDAPFGPVQISGADRTVSLQQNRVLYPFQVPEGYTHRQVFERLVNGRLPGGDATTPVPDQTQAAALIADRFLLGQPITEGWTWPGAPAIVDTYNDALLALWRVDGAIPAETEAAILIDYRILCHAPINEDWSWDGMPAVVFTYKDELVALHIAAGSPEPTVWLQDYVTAHGGTMPVQTQAAGIIKARLESGLTINSDWTWQDPPQIVTQYHQQILNQYPGKWNDRPTAITWLATYISAHGGANTPDPITWLGNYVANNGGYHTINTLGYAALIRGPAIPIVWNGYDPDRYTITGGPVVEDSGYDFMAKLADTRGCVMRFDELGQLVIDLRDVDPDTPPGYTIQPGVTGNLIKASRKTTRDTVYNVVVAYGSDPAAPTGYQIAYNNDPTSPLRWDGQFSAAPRYYASPLLRTPAEAAEAAATILSRYTGLPATLGLWTIPNPAVRPQDVLAAKVTGLSETHVIDEVTIPLAISGAGPVEIVTKTTNSVVIPDPPTDPGPTPDPTTDPVFATPGALHNIGSVPGQNHFNIGVGFDGTQTGQFSTYGKTHHDFAQSEIEAGLVIPGFYEMDNGRALLTSHPGGGRTSSNTSYARVEYRELEQDGKTKMAFNPSKGQHYVTGESAVEAPLAAAKPQVVIAQMHNSSDDTAMIYLNNATTIIAKINGTTVATLDSGYVLGTVKQWGIEVHDGVINFYWGDRTTPKYSKAAFTNVTAGQYFKAGDYMQWNLSNGDATLCKVHMVSLEHWHSQSPLSSSPWPLPARPPTSTGGGGGGGTTGGRALGVGGVATPPGAVLATGSSGSTLNITSGGTSSNPRCYDGKGFTVPKIVISADYVIVQNYVVRGGTNTGIFSTGTGNTIQNNDIAQIVSDGDVNAITFFGDNTTISYNAIGKGAQLLSGPDLGSHTDGVQTWNTSSKRASSNVLIEGNWIEGPASPDPAYIHQGVQAEGRNSTDGGGGGSGVSQNWTIRNNYFKTYGNQALNFLDIHNVVINGNIFAGSATHVVGTGDGTDGISYYSDNNVTGSYGSIGATILPGSPAGGGTGGDTSGSVDDGVEAAKLLGWGVIVDGDEFGYTGAPDPAKWGVYDSVGNGGNGRRIPGAFNVSGGVLTCTGQANGDTGGMAFNRYERYCRVECRARGYLTGSTSGSVYNMLLIMWPQSDQWPQGGEFDFCESTVGSGTAEAYLHIPGNSGSAQEHASRQLDLENWHNYAFEWTSKGITGWIDGVQWYSFPGFRQPPGAMGLTVQLDANDNGTMQPAKYELKWARIYTRPS